LIFATTTNAAMAARQATTVTPIVFAEVTGDPVKLGLVQSIARPGGNITGVNSLTVELNPKRLEILKELIPDLKHVLLVYDAADPESAMGARGYRDAARQLGIRLVEKTPRTQEEAREAILGARRSEVHAIVFPASGLALNIPGFVLEATSRQQIPAIFG